MKGVRLDDVRGRKPLLLSEPRTLWLVENGAVDVFLVPWNGSELTGAWHPLLRVDGPGLLVGMDVGRITDQWMVIGVATPDSRIARTDRDSWSSAIGTGPDYDDFRDLINGWLTGIGRVLPREARPKTSVQIAPGETRTPAAGEILTGADPIVWIRQKAGASTFLGRKACAITAGDAPFPLPEPAWLACGADSVIDAPDDATPAPTGPFWDGVDAFGGIALTAAMENLRRDQAAERRRLEVREHNDDAVFEEAVERLAAVVNPGTRQPHPGAASDPLLAAARLVGKAIGINFVAPTRHTERGARDPLGAIVKASHVNRRKVALRNGWWKTDSGPLLAFTEQDNRPVALLPRTATRYELHDPTRGEVRLVTPDVAAELAFFAYGFYRSFAQTVIDLKAVMRLGGAGSAKDIAMIIIMSLAGGALGMVTPIATGMLFDTVIPDADRTQLLQLTIGLIVLALSSTLFAFTRSVATLRVEGKMDLKVQSALWGRLLTLPVPFFREYSSGDLAMRANGINDIRKVLSGAALTAILGSVMSLFSFALLFYYSLPLAFVATAVLAIVLTVTVTTSLIKLRYERQIVKITGRIAGMVLEYLNGISKLKMTGSEGIFFRIWADDFSRQRTLTFKAQNTQNILEAFNSVFPIMGSMAIFYTLYSLSGAVTPPHPSATPVMPVGLSTGQFLAFNAAFGTFLAAILAMANEVMSVLRILPTYERAKPILEAAPEIDEDKADPGELTGDIEVNHVFFRYEEDTPFVLDDLSIHIRPGEFVALVGSSGCGKSTLLRLLLGFETQSSGTIYYDGKDLSGLDLSSVRRQFGVVLQNGQLLSGDIFTNIAASSHATLEDANEAARMAGLEADIEKLPMGMHTLVSEGSGGLSGGQRQRLMVARAIVHKPRILFFDEATSALDNNTQAVVSESIGKLEATRVVIAHRLSTIMNADRIFVLDKGHIVQQGTYDELIAQDGLFAELAKRQIA